MAKYGHHPILLVGGATGLIGDPKPTAERPMISYEEVEHNFKGLKKQAEEIKPVKEYRPVKETVSYDDFQKLDLIVGQFYNLMKEKQQHFFLLFCYCSLYVVLSNIVQVRLRLSFLNLMD